MTSNALLNISNISTAIADSDVPVISPEKQFIQLALEIETPLLLSVLNLVEILTISTSQVVPVFQLPPWVIGVYNWRGDILWMVDLNHLVGLSPWYQQQDYMSKHTVVVLKDRSKSVTSKSEELVLGLVVNRVDSMIVCEPEDIKTLIDLEIPQTIRSFLEGYWLGEHSQTHWILQGEAILNAMPTENQFTQPA